MGDMTSNSSPAPLVASATSEATGHEAWRVFNLDGLGYWLSTGIPTLESPQYLEIDIGIPADMDEGIWPTGYSFSNAGIAGCGASNWVFQASTDGLTWDDLDTQTGYTDDTMWGQKFEDGAQYFTATKRYRIL